MANQREDCIDGIAKKTGRSRKQVEDDLQELLDRSDQAIAAGHSPRHDGRIDSSGRSRPIPLRRCNVTSQYEDLGLFTASLVGLSGGTRLYHDVRGQVEKLAAIYAFQNGMNAQDAAKQAAEDIINFKYDYRDGYRIPNRNDTKPAGVS